jgi:rRNA-processing protein FCF1
MNGIIAETNQTSLQVIIDNFIVPELEELKQKKTKTSREEKRKNPQLTNHKLIKKKA